jgi:hypothetical protein
LYISLVFSALLFVFTWAGVRGAVDPRQAYPKVWFGLLFGFVPGMCILPTYLLHALLLGVTASICRQQGFGPRVFTFGSIAAFVLAYALVGTPRATELWQLAKEYPLESLEERLAYEPRRDNKPGGQPAKLLPDDVPELGSVWNMNRRDAIFRTDTLEDLHNGCVHLFVTAPGFGVTRMFHYLPSNIRRADPLRDAAPVPVPEAPQPGESPALSAGDLVYKAPTDGGHPAAGVERGALQSLHWESSGEFLNPLCFGYVRDRGHVAGFISHRFTRYPYKSIQTEGDGQWRFESLDLISFLKHPQPVAYVSKHLPRMDELRDAPTRPLDDFEAENLPKLRAGEELASAQGPRRVRMIGAIRARDECLKCHTAEAGELLGAFSYDLRRDRP